MYKCLSWYRKGTGTASGRYGVAELVANGDETAGMVKLSSWPQWGRDSWYGKAELVAAMGTRQLVWRS